MSSLTDISVGFRKFAMYAIISIVLLIILRFLFGLVINLFRSQQPQVIPIAPPDVRFGKLPNLNFGEAQTSSGMKFTQEFIEGKPPETTPSARVYSIPKKLPTFLAAERAKKFANQLEFTAEPEIITSTLYRYIDPIQPLRSLTLDIVNMNFHYRFDYTKNPQLFEHGQIPTKEQAIVTVKNFIDLNNLFDDSLLQGKITTEALVYNPSEKNFSPATSLSSANAIRVNFFRQDLDSLALLPPLFKQSYVFGLFIPHSESNLQILELSYKFWPIALDDFATYPVKSGQEAWEDLNNGQASVVHLGNNNPDNIIIRKIYLAYFDSSEPQPYLQPIFVFEGDNDFIAYLPTVAKDWLE